MSPAKLVIAIVAPTLTVLSFVAQTQKIVRTKDTKSLSTPMWLCSTASFAGWVAYGALGEELAIIIPNAVCFVLALVILTLKLRWS